MKNQIKAGLCTLLLCTLSTASWSQEALLKLKSGDYSHVNQKQTAWEQEELIGESFYRIIAFENLPDNEEKSRLKKAGIELLNYLPKNAFYAKISTNADWSVLPSAQVIEIERDYKLSKLLIHKDYPHWTLFGDDQIELIASSYTSLSPLELNQALIRVGATKISSIESLGTVHLRINFNQLEELYASSAFYFFETLPSEGEPENFAGRTNHRSNALNTEYSGGLSYNGSGVTVMMQDDGLIGPHIDYTGRIDQSGCGGCSGSANDTHADHVSGTIMSAGNLDPANRGMANGAQLLVYGASNANYGAVPNLYDNQGLVITSKSYSSGCNAGYDGLASQLDQQIRLRPALTHVFSAGNSGSDDCGYGAGLGWGNITGGHKSGKNVIAVGNLTSSDQLAGSSSRGPATDGRIKPDICGVGTSVTSTGPDNIYFTISGTSMSCPGVSGTIAQLYEGYRDLNGGNNPDGALIKAAVLNTGEDLGNYGPDFRYGWGRINARRAFEIISTNSYVSGSVGQGDNNIHTVSVPAGVSELRIMTYWADHEGSTSASQALVNDINMVVTDPSSTNYDPWVLDPSPNPTSLNAPAIRAVDNLNNMEQVSIVNPAAGTYNISIDGFSIPQGPQEYYLVYYFVRDEITLTHPIGGEGIDNGAGTIVRWDASAGTTPFTIEYSTDNGANWNSAGTANADRRYFSWITPNTVTGEAKIRVTRGAQSDESDAVFSLLDAPTGLTFNWSCPDSLNFGWNPVQGATHYEVYMLGSMYMDSIGTTTSTDFTYPLQSTSSGWFSVRAFGPTGARSERAIAIEKTPGEFNCLWSAPFAGFDVDCQKAGTGHCFNFTDQSQNTDATASYTWYFPGGTPATSTLANPVVCYSTPGDYDVIMVVDNGFGTDSIYTSDYLSVSITGSLPYFDGFEDYTNLSNLDQWSVNSPGGGQAWLITTDASLGGVKSARLFNYAQQGGALDELISGPINLSSLSPTDNMTLSFRYSYRKKTSSNTEALKVFIKKGCDESWVQRKTLIGNVLSPLTQTSPWTPQTDEDWITVHMTNVTSQYFTPDFRMKFAFESDGGNNIFLDNINLYQGAPSDDIIGIEEQANLLGSSIYPNPAEEELSVEFYMGASASAQLIVMDLSGKQISSQSLSAQVGKNLAYINVKDLSSGFYLVQLKVGTSTETMRFVKE